MGSDGFGRFLILSVLRIAFGRRVIICLRFVFGTRIPKGGLDARIESRIQFRGLVGFNRLFCIKVSEGRGEMGWD